MMNLNMEILTRAEVEGALARASATPPVTAPVVPLIASPLVAETEAWLVGKTRTLGSLLASDRAVEYVAILRACADFRKRHEPEPLHEAGARGLSPWKMLARWGRGDCPRGSGLPHAWLSYALDSATLLTAVPQQGDMAIAVFAKGSAASTYDFQISVDGITVGTGAMAANLATIFSLEGCSTLNGTYQPLAVTSGTPVDGKVTVTAQPTGTSFFIKAKMKP